MAWRTLFDALHERAALQGHRPALWRKQGGSAFRPWTWSELWAMAGRFGRGLLSLGLEAGRPLAVLCGHRPEWPVLELGAMGAGLPPAALFDAWPPALLWRLLSRLDASAVVVESGGDQLQTLLRLRADLPGLQQIIVLDPAGSAGGAADRVRSFAEVMERGGGVKDGEAGWEERLARLDPSAPAAVSVTPGTVDEPKLSTCSHGALLAHARRFARAVPLGSEDAALARLPPALCLERSVFHLAYVTGAQVYVAPPRGSFRAQLADARPTFVHALPQDWEALRRSLEEKLEAETPSRRKVLGWARKAALQAHKLDDDYLPVPGALGARLKLGQTLVFGPLKLELGVHAARCLLCGLGPVRTETLELFASLDLPLNEAWGLCEAGGPVTLNCQGARRLGSQGRPLPGVALRISGDGEILVRSDTLCAGAPVDRHGFLRTGDLGDLDSDGFLHVLGRRDELLVLRGRRRTPARVVEARLASLPLVSGAVAFADGRAPVALLSLDRERCARFAREHGLPDDPVQLALHPALLARLERDLAAAQAGAPQTERVRRFAVVPDGFSVADGERTPAGLPRRKAIAQKRAALLEPLLELERRRPRGAAASPAPPEGGLE